MSLKNAPFQILGYNEGNYYFMPNGTHEILEMKPTHFRYKKKRHMLAPERFWKDKNLLQITSDLMHTCQAVGVFNLAEFYNNCRIDSKKRGWSS